MRARIRFPLSASNVNVGEIRAWKHRGSSEDGASHGLRVFTRGAIIIRLMVPAHHAPNPYDIMPEHRHRHSWHPLTVTVSRPGVPDILLHPLPLLTFPKLKDKS